jgi:sugar phosphate permease
MMIPDQKLHWRPYFGWWIVLITGVVSGLGHGFYNYGFSALFKPIASELGFSRAATSVAAGIGRLEGGLDAPITGWLVDRFGPKWIMVFGLSMMSLGLVLMSSVSSLWNYYVVWGLITGIGLNVSLTIAVDKTITNWFVEKRGLALGLKFSLLGVVGMLVMPLITALCASQGWRTTCLIWAAVMLCAIPFVGIFVSQKRPEYYGLLPDGAQVRGDSQTEARGMVDHGVAYASGFQETEFTLRQAMRTRAYWILAAVYAFQMVIAGGLTVHCIPFLTDMGINAALAGSMMGTMIFSTIPTRFLSGYLADRVKRQEFLLAGAFALDAIGFAAFILWPTIPTAYLFLILYGLGTGAPTTLILVMQGRYFGRKAFGSIIGMANLFRMPGAILAPVYAGWVFDRTGSYRTAFATFLGMALFAALLACFIRPPRAPEAITDIHHIV